MMSAEEFFKDSEDEETSDDTSKEKVDEDEEDKELQESLEAYRKQNARLFRS